MLARNVRLYHGARDAFVDMLYPIAAVPLSQHGWRRHYGKTWHQFAANKSRFDPHRILAPGVGIF